jgi:hypothetical protein
MRAGSASPISAAAASLAFAPRSEARSRLAGESLQILVRPSPKELAVALNQSLALELRERRSALIGLGPPHLLYSDVTGVLEASN